MAPSNPFMKYGQGYRKNTGRVQRQQLQEEERRTPRYHECSNFHTRHSQVEISIRAAAIAHEAQGAFALGMKHGRGVQYFYDESGMAVVSMHIGSWCQGRMKGTPPRTIPNQSSRNVCFLPDVRQGNEQLCPSEIAALHEIWQMYTKEFAIPDLPPSPPSLTPALISHLHYEDPPQDPNTPSGSP